MIVKTLSELSSLVNGELFGDGTKIISGLADIKNASSDNLCFLADNKHLELLQATKAGAVIVPLDSPEIALPNIRVKDPSLAAAIIHNYFCKKDFVAKGISAQAVIGEGCIIPEAVTIDPKSVIGDRVQIGQRVIISAGVVVGDDVKIGDDTVIHPNVSIYPNCVLGNRVIIHSGSVIGADGFGYVTDEEGRHIKRPHVGIVQIDDDVELGANVCIDRATFGKTWIKKGVKIDNLVQIAHNVTVGEGSLIVAQVGIAGSSSIGRNVVLGGQVGLAGHIHLGDRTMVAAKAGVHNNQPADSVVSGVPAVPHKKWLKASTSLIKLPEIIKDFRKMQKQIELLLGNRKEE